MILYNLVVAPIEMVVDWVFTFFTIKFSSFGVIGAIFGVSLVINFLALPIYNVADALQAKERKIAKEMEPQLKRIKGTFKGDERFMMTQAYYRECKYNPIYTLRSSLSILIEIPFFIAAYHYLSHAEALKNVSFWIFKDLGAADSLFHIGNFPINVLPILMTVINLVSGAIYSKDTTLREKIQIYVLAAVFLALLYNSPSGLVIYWILNNLFSLAKNVVLKMKNPGKVLQVIVDVILALFACYFLFFNHGAIKKRLLLAFFAAAVILFSVLKRFFVHHLSKKDCRVKHGNDMGEKFGNNTMSCSGLTRTSSKSQFALFIFSALGLALLCGFYLPSSAIATSPTEFAFLGKGADSPLVYVWSSLFTFLGFFSIWPALIYFMFGDKVKKWECAVFFVAFLTALADVFIFKADYGTVDVLFQLDNKDVLKTKSIQSLVSIAFVIPVCLLFFVLRKLGKINIACALLVAVCFTEIAISISNVSSINKKFVAFADSRIKNGIPTENNDFDDEIKPVYHLSKTGKNVVVFFLDRAVNSFFPYVLKDVPELNAQMEGFVYYPNTVSFSGNTDSASPAMMGGYEYTPEKINERKNELLKAKHNEASLVAPTLFADAGYEVTITDPVEPNYSWKGDLSAFNKNDICAMEIIGKYSKNMQKELNIDNLRKVSNVKKEIRNFSIIQILLPKLRKIFNGDFRIKHKNIYAANYLDNISCLYYLPKLTDFCTKKNQYIFIDNDTTHEPVLLGKDFLIPTENPNFNCEYKTDNYDTYSHYQVFTAAFKQLGKYFDFLKENDVYDNTRIIIVADHGFYMPLNDYATFRDSSTPGIFTPILLFKDFNSNGNIKISEEFMTNADTLFLAKKNLNISNINPFTSNKLVQDKANGVNALPIPGEEGNPTRMIDKTTFNLNKYGAFHIEKNVFDEKNWIPLLDWEKENDNNRGEK